MEEKENLTVPNNGQFGQSSNFNVREEDRQAQALADSVKPSEQLQPLKENIQDLKGDDSQEMIDEVPVDQNNQEKIKSKTLVTLLSFLVRKMLYKVHYLFSYREAIKHGLKIAFLIGNREVYSSQIDKLYNEISSSSDKKFSNPVIVVSLERALKSGLRAVDADGKEITLDTPDLWLYVAILDGQHRLMVCLEHLDVDLDLELIDYDGNLMSFIQILNSMDKNWNNEDRKKSNLATGKSTNQLYIESEIIQREFGVSPKYAEYLLTFKRDATKKKDLIAGKDSTPYNEENGRRGYQLYMAIAYKFGDEKNVKRVEFVDAIVHAHNQNGDSNNKTFTRDMKCFVTMMDDTTRNKIITRLANKNYGELKSTLFSDFQKFCSSHKDDMEDLEKEQDMKISEWKSQKETVAAKNDIIKTLKKGTPNEILANRKKVATQNALKKTKQQTENK
ncbi:hypothetical protein [Bacteroides sp.]|uniref:hypothetical protein n=1 Tax=Bacteroides sp. TaxID=29523 RepID=UPI0025B88AC0|nr:hypothetical protein [Bacteroides sp.]